MRVGYSCRCREFRSTQSRIKRDKMLINAYFELFGAYSAVSWPLNACIFSSFLVNEDTASILIDVTSAASSAGK